MSKRSGYSGISNHFNSNEAKKPRVETNNVDDLWGDDLDFDDLDKCVLMATQICEQKEICTQKSDVSILPSYGGFREQSNEMCTSTQLVSLVQPTNFTAKTPIPLLDHSKRDENLKLKLAQLEKQYQEKDGEVSILRSQLSELKCLHEIQQDKSNQEWSAKFLSQKKQMQQIEKELELKITNAEFTLLSLNSKIASKNLKNLDLTQKLKDLTNPNATCSQFSKNFNEEGRSTDVTKVQTNERKMTDLKLRIVTREGWFYFDT
ncbi:hypothetical protein FQA39_LY10246 [Lamprigera yunnana]|nr:hypothetical protein FQA39_LY10246 [Lamprigera yunnana]